MEGETGQGLLVGGCAAWFGGVHCSCLPDFTADIAYISPPKLPVLFGTTAAFTVTRQALQAMADRYEQQHQCAETPTQSCPRFVPQYRVRSPNLPCLTPIKSLHRDSMSEFPAQQALPNDLHIPSLGILRSFHWL